MTILVAIAAFVALLTTGCQNSTAEFKTGVATRDITLAGQPTADPLLAKALVFRQGNQKAALVFCDQVFVSKEVTDLARKNASELTGIPFSNISIMATHTHNSRDRTYWSSLSKIGNELAVELADDFESLSADEFSAKLAKGIIHKLGSKEISEKEAKEMADGAVVDPAEELALKIVNDFIKNLAGEPTEEELNAIDGKEANAAEIKLGIEANEAMADALHKHLKNELSIIRINQFIDRVAKDYANKSVSEVSVSLFAELGKTLAKDLEKRPAKEEIDRIAEQLLDRALVRDLDEKLKKEVADNPVEMPADAALAKELKAKQAKKYAEKRSGILAKMKVEIPEEKIDEILLRELFRKLNDQLSLIRANAIAKELSNETIGSSNIDPLIQKLSKEFAKKRSTMLKSKVAATIRKHFKDKRNNELSHKMTWAIVEAYRNAKPVKIRSAVADMPGHANNRRYYMEDGSIKYNPAVMQDGLVKHAEPVDDEVSFIMFDNTGDNQPMTSLSNFPMHVCTIGPIESVLPDGREINTPDYPLYIEQALQKELGKDFISLFGQGCCGDINHVDCFDIKSADGFAESKRHGDAIAALMLKELPNARQAVQPSLAILSETVEAPLKTYTREELAWAQGKPVDPELAKELDRHPAKKRAISRLARARENGTTFIPAEVQVFRLSKDVAIVTIPGEMFVEFGMDIKKASPFATTLVIELSNTRKLGYIATERAAAEAEINSYKIETARIDPKGGRAITNSAIRLLKELHKDL